MADSKAGTENTQNEPGTFFQCQEVKKCSKNPKDVGMSKKHRSQSERALNSQNCNNLSNKINNVMLDYNSKFKINSLESILI